MEITGWTIYWITRLDALCAIGTGTIFLCLTAAFFAGVAGFLLSSHSIGDEDLANSKKAFKFARRCMAVALLGVPVVAFVPSTKNAAAILVIPALANNEDVQGLGEDFVNLAREWMQELRPKTEETK